ncbi:MAG: sugar phosphate isomerase/epimerase [Frankiales bacterium]|nr:sugar phosphate isomerase/epimerase [Frankiales bacterium]
MSGLPVADDLLRPELVSTSLALGYRNLAPSLALLPPDKAALTQLRRRAADQGIRIAILDGVASWLPLSGTRFSSAASFERVADVAAELGAHAVSLLPVRVDLPAAQLIDCFGRACDVLSASGTVAQIEFSPLGGIPDLAAAWRIVQAADRSNGGLVLDTWHFYRGDPDLSLLSSIPGERITSVQISDAAKEPNGSLWQDTLHHRMLPGVGDIPLPAIIEVLRGINGLNWVGPEILSEALDRLPLDQRLRTAVEAIEQLL